MIVQLNETYYHYCGVDDPRSRKKIHDVHLFEERKPVESNYFGDFYKHRATIPAAEAFRPHHRRREDASAVQASFEAFLADPLSGGHLH
jgi:hypothetical protein